MMSKEKKTKKREKVKQGKTRKTRKKQEKRCAGNEWIDAKMMKAGGFLKRKKKKRKSKEVGFLTRKKIRATISAYTYS